MKQPLRLRSLGAGVMHRTVSPRSEPQEHRFGDMMDPSAMFLLLLLAVLAVPLMAQGDVARASLTGTVLDPSGGAVSEARLTLSSRDTGITRRAVTGNRGEYAFHMLPPGAYLMRVQKMGF